jgi:hypothetical protein
MERNDMSTVCISILPTFIYFVESRDRKFIKVGESERPARRIKELAPDLRLRYPRKQWDTVDVKLIGVMPSDNPLDEEKAFRKRFKSQRSKPFGDWYYSRPEIQNTLLRLSIGLYH